LSFQPLYQLLLNDDLPHLFDLIWLGERAARLEIQDLQHIRTSESMVAAVPPFLETETHEEGLQVVEPDVGV